MIHWQNTIQPKAPFVASIFNYYLSEDLDGYAAYDELTLKLVKEMPGFLGYESMKFEGRGSFISYWEDMEAVKTWSAHPIHQEAKQLGVSKWYRYYHSMIAEVNAYREHGGTLIKTITNH
jgi:heme-degrading monooxygenase HmoA